MLFTLTATPSAMALAFFASDMAAPVPIVLKLPVFSAVASTFLVATILPISVFASWLAMVRPTAAATMMLLLLSSSATSSFLSVALLASPVASLTPDFALPPSPDFTAWDFSAFLEVASPLTVLLLSSADFSSRRLSILSPVLLSFLSSAFMYLPLSRSLAFSSKSLLTVSPALARLRATSAPIAVARALVTSSEWVFEEMAALPATSAPPSIEAFTPELAMFRATLAPTATASPTEKALAVVSVLESSLAETFRSPSVVLTVAF